jgi:DNA-binding YbaB/EbfC family protein
LSGVDPAAVGREKGKEDSMAKGIGGIGNLLKQAQEMQARISKIQEDLGQKTVDGSSGGGMVQVTVNGQFNLAAIKIDATVIRGEEKEMLEDLILAAVNDGMRKAREMVAAEMSKVTGGFKIPGLMP